MTMTKFDVDTSNKLFIAKTGITAFDVKQDFYSDAKEHWIADNTANKFNFPIRTIGGDPIGSGVFAGDLYFLRDGWKIRPQETNHTLNITGNLFLDDGESGGLFVPTTGGYTVLTNMRNSNLVLAQTTGGLIPSQQEIRDALTLPASGSYQAGSIDAKLTDVYSAKIVLITNSTDNQYIVTWFKNANPITTGITNAKLQVVKVYDGTDLIPLSNMTQIASLGRYKYYAYTAQKISRGVSYLAITTATIAGATRSWDQPIGKST